MNSSSLPVGGLRWLNPTYEYPVQLFIFKGYEAIDYAAAYGSGATTGYGPNYFDFDLYQRLIPAPVVLWQPDVAKTRSAPPHYTEHISGWAPGFTDVVDHSALPRELLKPSEIMEWLLDEMQRIKLRPHRYDLLFIDPSRLIQLGYQLSRLAGREFPINSTPFAAALCMIGLGSAYFFRREKICPNCFRIANPELGRCNLHSQSKYVRADSRSRALNSQAARTGRRVKSIIKWPENIPNGPLPDISPLESRTAGMLWPLRGQQHIEWNQLISEALKDAPLVCKLLPQNFLVLSNKKQLELLRTVLDENEWQIGRWPLKIVAAQKWFEYEQIVAPGPKNSGFSEVNAERLMKACALRDLGWKPKEIAKQLGISDSHLSQLWRRQRIRDRADS